jgi:hypothetical protein
MNALLISALFATLSAPSDMAARTDTINRYVIDGKTITAFDGSQLISKTIVKYDINYKNSTEGVIKEHNIKTKISDPSDKSGASAGNLPEGTGTTSTSLNSNGFSIRELEGAFKEGETPLIVVDDEVFSGSIEDIDSENVRSMTVLKGKAAETIWGEKGKNGVIDIQTKKK